MSKIYKSRCLIYFISLHQRFVSHLASINPVGDPTTTKVDGNAYCRPAEEGVVWMPVTFKELKAARYKLEWVQIDSNAVETGTCNRQVLHSRDFPDSESEFLYPASDWHVTRSDPNRPEKYFPIFNHFCLVNTQPEVLQLLSTIQFTTTRIFSSKQLEDFWSWGKAKGAKVLFQVQNHAGSSILTFIKLVSVKLVQLNPPFFKFV